ncbi:MAG: tripartite tricarboxylate transporter permease [Candidatus Wallbacteria bacterium]|nr:tripartite tricarboxylate transporter permease [Candidatus Wallbacteria bacterium]
MTSTMVFMSILASLIGMIIAAAVSLIPGLHIYNVIAITMLFTFTAVNMFAGTDPMVLTSFMLGMVVGFSMLFTVSSQYFQPNDESFRSIMLPHERFLLEGRGHEAVMLGGIGGLLGLFVITILIPILSGPISTVLKLIQPHHYWILAVVIVFILMTEWPKDHGVGADPKQRFQDGWVQLLMGYFTFFAAGILGIFIFFRTLVPVESSFQSLMPVFVGLFSVPSFIMTFVTRTRVPVQHACQSIQVRKIDIARGGISGFVAGAFASLNPGMTPGPALLLSGHLTCSSGDRQFLIGGGTARLLYYVGALLLFFLPGVYMRRGGAAINISLFFVPETTEQFLLVCGIIAFIGGFSFLLLAPFSRLCIWLVHKFDYKVFSLIGLIILVGLTAWITSWQGLIILTVSTMLGIVPNMWHTRRISLLAVLLVPICLNMAGIGPKIAHFLGIY